MPSDVRQADIHAVVERYHARYEVRPYYVLLDQHPVGAPPIQKRIQAGFDVDLYGVLEKEQFPPLGSAEGRMVADYFETVAQRIQAKAGHNCEIEIIPYTDSLALDTHQHFRPEAMLLIRITHYRGLDQPWGPPEEQALKDIRETLHELGVRQG